MSRYCKGILIPILLIVAFIIVGKVDGGAEAGSFPKTEKANVKIVVTLEDGNTYVVADYNEDITFNTYGSENKMRWLPVGNYYVNVKY